MESNHQFYLIVLVRVSSCSCCSVQKSHSTNQPGQIRLFGQLEFLVVILLEEYTNEKPLLAKSTGNLLRIRGLAMTKFIIQCTTSPLLKLSLLWNVLHEMCCDWWFDFDVIFPYRVMWNGDPTSRTG